MAKPSGQWAGEKPAHQRLFGQFSHPTSIRMPWENRFAVPNQQIPLVYGGAGV